MWISSTGTHQEFFVWMPSELRASAPDPGQIEALMPIKVVCKEKMLSKVEARIHDDLTSGIGFTITSGRSSTEKSIA